jgi:hypothetical protein
VLIWNWWSQFPLFLCTLTVYINVPAAQHLLNVSVVWTYTKPTFMKLYFTSNLFEPNISCYSQGIFVLLVSLLELQVTTPHTFVPSHNTSSRVSHPQSTLYMWSPSWYGLIGIKHLTLQFLAKRQYLLHNTKVSVSVFSSLYNGPSPPHRPTYILFYILYS